MAKESAAFKKASRTKSKLKLAMTGPSGSGKTYSALLLASGLGNKIAVIDTENGSASLYAGAPGMPDFDVLEISPPFLSSKYEEAISAASRAGYDVLVIDSISHQWSGEGGILDRKEKEQMAKPALNSYTLWAKYTPEHERFKSAINNAPIHVIATMRSKQEYVLETNEKGKSAPKKVGMAPIQRDGAEYEFTTVFDLAVTHYANVSKDRTGLFDGQVFICTKETGEKILEWAQTGADRKEVLSEPEKLQQPVTVPPAADLTRSQMVARDMKKTGWQNHEVVEYLKKRFQASKLADLSEPNFLAFQSVLETQSPDVAFSVLEATKGDIVL